MEEEPKSEEDDNFLSFLEIFFFPWLLFEILALDSEQSSLFLLLLEEPLVCATDGWVVGSGG